MIIIQLTQSEFSDSIKKAVCEALASQPTKPPQTSGDLISRKEAAKYLQVSYPTLNKWEKDGTVKPIRLGSRVYFKKSDLDI